MFGDILSWWSNSNWFRHFSFFANSCNFKGLIIANYLGNCQPSQQKHSSDIEYFLAQKTYCSNINMQKQGWILVRGFQKKAFFKEFLPQKNSWFQYPTENMQLQYALSGQDWFVVTESFSAPDDPPNMSDYSNYRTIELNRQIVFGITFLFLLNISLIIRASCYVSRYIEDNMSSSMTGWEACPHGIACHNTAAGHAALLTDTSMSHLYTCIYIHTYTSQTRCTAHLYFHATCTVHYN